MDNVFLDANVVINFLCEREPFYYQAARIMTKAYRKEISVACSPITLATVSYLMERSKIDTNDVFLKLTNFCTICQMAPIDTQIVVESLNSGFSDFEDSLQYVSAKHWGANVILTRNKSDFAMAQLRVTDPIEFLGIE